MPRENLADDGEDRRVLSRAARPPDQTWAYGPDPEHIADLYLSAERPRRSTVLLVHGGFWRPAYDRSHIRPFAAYLADRGHTVVAPEYRRVPGSPDVTLADLRLALTEAAKQPWAGRAPLQAAGHSAGGHLVLLLAGEDGTPLQSALALAPVADLTLAEALHLDDDAVPAYLGAHAASRPDLDPAQRPAPGIPVAIVHGRDDSIVPLTVSESYVSAHPGDGQPRLLELAGVAHFELIDPQSAAIAAVESALDDLAP